MTMMTDPAFITFLNNTVTNSTSYDDVVTPKLPYADFYVSSQRFTGLILYPVICIPGFAVNILTLLVMSNKNMRTSTNAFLSALAVSDALKLANDIMYFIVIALKEVSPNAANRAFGHAYPYAHFIFNISSCISAWLTVSVAVERYIMVCHPVRAKSLCSRQRAIITIVFVYFIMTCAAMPSAFRYRTITCISPETNTTVWDIELTGLWTNETFVWSYTWALNLIRCIIPLIILIALNFCIINALKRSRANKKLASRNRVTSMLIMVIVVFLVCVTPDAIMSTFLGFGYHEADLLVKGIREYTDWLLAVNAAVNFLVYCACNKLFRQNFVKIFCRKPASGKVAQIDETQYRRLSEAAAVNSVKDGLTNIPMKYTEGL